MKKNLKVKIYIMNIDGKKSKEEPKKPVIDSQLANIDLGDSEESSNPEPPKPNPIVSTNLLDI